MRSVEPGVVFLGKYFPVVAFICLSIAIFFGGISCVNHLYLAALRLSVHDDVDKVAFFLGVLSAFCLVSIIFIWVVYLLLFLKIRIRFVKQE